MFLSLSANPALKYQKTKSAFVPLSILPDFATMSVALSSKPIGS